MRVVHRRRRGGLVAALTLLVIAALGVPGVAAAAAVAGNPIAGPGGKCVDVSGDDTGVNGTAVQLWDCQATSADQHWSWSGSALTTIGRCLDITSGGTANGTKLQLWDCNGTGAQQWTQQGDGSLRNPQSGRCVDSPSGATANGTRLQIWDCNGTAAQKFTVTTPANPGTCPAYSDNPDFGPNVHIYDRSMSDAAIQASLDSVFNAQKDTASAQFGTRRDALVFKPSGTPYNVGANIGFNTSILGVGQNPDDVRINGAVTVDAFNASDAGNATQNFWRSAENLSVNTNGGTNRWAVAQAAPYRRMHVIGGLNLFPASYGWASGGYISDSKIDGTAESASQQQWYTKDSMLGSWSGSNWNMVFSGTSGAPATNFSTNPASGPRYTTLASTPVSRDVPYLYLDAAGKYRVFLPALRTNASGPSWAGGSTPGSSLPMSTFFVARPGDSAATINTALANGCNVFFTPGIYHVAQTLHVTKANTVVLGIGYPTIIPDNGVNAMDVADVDGVRLKGLLFDAGTTNSDTLLKVGLAKSGVSHAANPVTVQDVFFRIGGMVAGKATNSLVVNANNTIVDHTWAWRADHGAGIGWTVNTADNGLTVNGDNVLATGLFVEHYQKNEVVWNGANGKIVFFQNEMPYDPPNQAAWMNGSQNGYPAIKVASGVSTFEAWGLGSYCFFNVNNSVSSLRAFEVPAVPGVKFHDMAVVSLGGVGTISHVINDTGAAANSGNTNSYLLNFP
ncbi:ricin-type beta-trefoil lectin domain protein [Actinoplanes oblitus]|uniref:Ricin-type beta-trefoil lectin domain protein n=1 Tax=Actinoplanes oblitus TaxID=3040509 RepID=A0ABY8WC74_9ACTN|nr:ricin-type beta-trefoil lectin domain protein [Actinoplanes oblitus]WIM94542.1 ricin-type beta-trefoil lectin domain protein [Actinoplanes oblitus]